MCAIQPLPGTPVVGRFEKRPDLLAAGAKSGMNAIMDTFGRGYLQIPYPPTIWTSGFAVKWDDGLEEGERLA